MKTDKPKVFISYSSQDADFSELVKMKLEEGEKFEVWKDTYQISAGEEWRNEIDFGLLNSDAIILILNGNSAKSSYVTYEWAFSLGGGKNIIPILLKDCEIHPRLKVLQYLDFKDKKRPWHQLIERIENIKSNKSKNQISRTSSVCASPTL